MPTERLDKIIASQSSFSRKEVKNLIKDGHVCVNGSIVNSPELGIDTDRDKITVSGKPFTVKKNIYIMMNKPAGILSAARDTRVKTVVDLVPQALQRKGLFPAGRLDKDTTGFLLITDDGDFAHKILSPKNHIFKTYEARLSKPLAEDELLKLSQGIMLADGTQCLPAFVEVLRRGSEPLAQIRIQEGKYHQIKRMFAAVDNVVVSLKRTQMGALKLDDMLAEGECRELTDSEVLLMVSSEY